MDRTRKAWKFPLFDNMRDLNNNMLEMERRPAGKVQKRKNTFPEISEIVTVKVEDL